MNDSHKGVGRNGTLLGTRKLGSLHLFFQVPNFLDVGSNPVSWGNGSCTTTLGVGGIFLYQFGAKRPRLLTIDILHVKLDTCLFSQPSGQQPHSYGKLPYL